MGQSGLLPIPNMTPLQGAVSGAIITFDRVTGLGWMVGASGTYRQTTVGGVFTEVHYGLSAVTIDSLGGVWQNIDGDLCKFNDATEEFDIVIASCDYSNLVASDDGALWGTFSTTIGRKANGATAFTALYTDVTTGGSLFGSVDGAVVASATIDSVLGVYRFFADGGTPDYYDYTASTLILDDGSGVLYAPGSHLSALGIYRCDTNTETEFSLFQEAGDFGSYCYSGFVVSGHVFFWIAGDFDTVLYVIKPGANTISPIYAVTAFDPWLNGYIAKNTYLYYVDNAAVFPTAAQVQTGVEYGPNGDDYTGTLSGGGGGVSRGRLVNAGS